MSKTFYARLHLLLDGQGTVPSDAKGIFAPAFLQRFTYTLKITPKAGQNINNGNKTFSGRFTNLRSADHELKTEGASLDTLAEANAKFEVLWQIYFDGKLNHTVVGKLFDRSRLASSEWFKFDIRFTKSNTKWNTGGADNVLKQAVSSGVGWYLVKETEAFGALVKRAFIKPEQADWDVLKEVNKHLSKDGLSTMTLLKPGQVVIFSKTKSSRNPKLAQMMGAAQKAQDAWVEANKDGQIDKAEMLLIDLLMNGHKLVEINPHDVEGLDDTSIAMGLSLTDTYKPFADSSIGLAAASFKQVNKAHAALLGATQSYMEKNPYTTEKGTTKRAARAAAQQHPKAFRLLNDSSLARQLLQRDTGIKANRARDYIRQEVQLRSANANGGINGVAESLGKVERYSKALRRAGYVGIALDLGSTTVKAYDAYSKGDTAAGNVEVGKGLGSVAGGAATGALVSWLLLGLATGGTGLVVIGVAAAVAGYYGGKAGEKLGNEGAEIYNNGYGKYIQEHISPHTGDWLK